MKFAKYLFALSLLYAGAAFATGYIGAPTPATGSTGSLRTGSYTPTAGNSLIMTIWGNNLSGFPLTGYSGSGTPGDGVNTYNLLCYSMGQGGYPLTLAAAPTTGATSATLSSAFGGGTNTYEIMFSDGEFRSSTISSGATSISWSGALTGLSFTTTVISATNGVLTWEAVYQATGVAATAVQPGAASTAGNILSVYVAEYNGIAAATNRASGSNVANPADCNWAYENSPGTSGANVLNTGTVSVTGSSILWGFAQDLNGNAGVSGAGTSPVAFTGRSLSGIASALAEDASVSTSSAATFGVSGSYKYDGFLSMGVSFPLAGAGASTGAAFDVNHITASQWVSESASASLGATGAGDLRYECNATSGAVTLTLPTAVNNWNTYSLVKTDSSGNACTFATTSSQTINGASTIGTSTQWATIKVTSDNSNWLLN